MAGRWRTMGRGMRGHCPRCNEPDVFSSYFDLRETCPQCGLRFEREDGYWLGAMMVNMGLVEAIFGAVFIGGMVVSWPDVPWTGLTIAGIAINALLPVLFYPRSKTTWLGLDLAFNPANVGEEADAITARTAAPTAARTTNAGGERTDGAAGPGAG